MKKLFLFATLALFALNVNAQGENESNDESSVGWSKGDMYISGSVGLTSMTFGDDKENEFNIMPQFGMFLSDNIAAGVQVGYMSYKEEGSSNVTFNENNTIMIGAYGKYICRPNERFTPYIGLGVNYMSTSYDHFQGNPADFKEDGFQVGVGAGLVYGLSDHWWIGANHAGLSYTTVKADTDNAESRDTFDIGLNWKELNFSLAYKF